MPRPAFTRFSSLALAALLSVPALAAPKAEVKSFSDDRFTVDLTFEAPLEGK